MAKERQVMPTDAELAVLQVLWSRGPSTVRQVHDAMGDRGVRYTTTLKTLQNMMEKGLVHRQSADLPHVYVPGIQEAPTQRRLLGELLDQAFGGSAAKLVMQALSAGDISPEELREIRKLLKDKGASHERNR